MRRRGDARSLDALGRQIHHTAESIRDEAVKPRHLSGEEICRGQDLPVELQKLPPAHAGLASSRCGVQMVAPLDVPHRDRVEVAAEVCQSALDTSIAPGWILLGHTRSAKMAAVAAAVERLCDQSLVPPQEGRGGGDGRHLSEALATEWVGQSSKAAALGVGKP